MNAISLNLLFAYSKRTLFFFSTLSIATQVHQSVDHIITELANNLQTHHMDLNTEFKSRNVNKETTEKIQLMI